MLRDRELAAETPEFLDFVKGVRWITRKPTETDATKAFRDYLRVNLRNSAIGHPRELTDEEVKILLEPLANGSAKTGEDAEIKKLMDDYRRDGFCRWDLIKIKESHDKMQANVVIPYQNSKKGRMGGRPVGGKKVKT